LSRIPDPFLSTNAADKESSSLGGGSLNAIPVSATAQTLTVVAPTSVTPQQPPDDCSCGINAILESRSHKIQVNPGQQPVPTLNRARLHQVCHLLANSEQHSTLCKQHVRAAPTHSAPNSATASRDELLLAEAFASIVNANPQQAGEVLRATLTLSPRAKVTEVVESNTLPGFRSVLKLKIVFHYFICLILGGLYHLIASRWTN